jgi:hypothetical protein
MEPQEPSEPHTYELREAVTAIDRNRKIMGFTGYLMLAMSPFLFAFPLIIRIRGITAIPPAPDKEGVFVWFMQYYDLQLFSCFGAVFLAFIGLRLLGAAGKALPRVIPSEDRALLEPLVREANKDAIGQYVILSSLGGFTGTFQKIGFSGLPLATVTLTILFCALSFLKPEFIEFAKLTLGAFIGSFVQRGTDASKLPEIKWDK